MNKTIVIVGKKQSGKSSLANFLYGFYLTRNKVLSEFTIDEDGKLIVPSLIIDENGQEKLGHGILELQAPTQEVGIWASQNIWPLIKTYAFADALKVTCMNLFGLSYDQCFGSDESKNSPTRISWNNMLKLLSVKDGNKLRKEDKVDRNMTAREVLQYFGTNICRTLIDDIWIENLFTQIEGENTRLAIVTDCRYKNEIIESKNRGAKLVKLTASKFEDNHTSETDLDDLPPETYDLIIDNQNMNIKEKNYAMYDGLVKWGWLNIMDN